VDIKHIAYSAACGLRDVLAQRSGISATEYLARREAAPNRFAKLPLREAWIERQVARRLSQRVRVAL
jgi:hypothetical protein